MTSSSPAPQSPPTPQAADFEATIAKLKAAIFDAFAVTHIAEARIEYDTDGEDGALQVHPCTCSDENGQPVACPDFMLPESLAFPHETPMRGRMLDDAILALVYELLEQEPCVWAGEDGASGTIQFFTANRAIKLEHTRRFVRYETHARAF